MRAEGQGLIGIERHSYGIPVADIFGGRGMDVTSGRLGWEVEVIIVGALVALERSGGSIRAEKEILSYWKWEGF